MLAPTAEKMPIFHHAIECRVTCSGSVGVVELISIIWSLRSQKLRPTPPPRKISARQGERDRGTHSLAKTMG